MCDQGIVCFLRCLMPLGRSTSISYLSECRSLKRHFLLKFLPSWNGKSVKLKYLKTDWSVLNWMYNTGRCDWKFLMPSISYSTFYPPEHFHQWSIIYILRWLIQYLASNRVSVRLWVSVRLRSCFRNSWINTYSVHVINGAAVFSA